MPGDRPGFRSDLEGLRGVAILLVVLFHAGVRALDGGFVGVDVFFVLSGFFITGLLVREMESAGRIDVASFYARRALRLLPALLVVLLSTLALVMWLYAPIDREPIAANARAVALYGGNIEFARTATDYFGAGDNPLLHTWSLAVEEQFYLVWPLLFVLAAGLYGSSSADGDTATGESRRRRLVLSIAVAGGASLVASLVLTRAAQPWAFFGMPTRVWEFALGGMLVMLLSRRTEAREASERGRLAEFVQALGLGAITMAVLRYHGATPYPGTAALLPACGTAAMIVGGHRAPDAAISRVLSEDWLQSLGRLSYAWYLWHWPLVGLGAVIDPTIGVAGRLAWSVLALGLAWLTYRVIERPARDARSVLGRMPAHWIAPAALAASAGVALVAHGTMVAARNQAATGAQRAFAAARSDRMEHVCWGTTLDEWKGPCAFGDTQSSTVIALLGDSHAEHWLGALDRAGRERHWKIVAMVKGGCPVADVPRLINGRMKRHYLECTRYREGMLRHIIAMRPRAVILSSWDHYVPVNGMGAEWQLTPAMWRRGLRRTYSRLTAAGIPTLAIRGTPRTWFDVPSCLSRRAAGLPFARPCVYERAASLSRVAIEAQNDAARGLPIRFIDMNDAICATRLCPVTRDGLVVFTDDNHLTASFSRTLAPVLGVRVEAALQ